MNYQHVSALFKMYMELPTDDRYQQYLIFVNQSAMYEALIGQGYRAVLVDPLSGIMIKDIKSWIEDHQADMMNYKSICCLGMNENHELETFLSSLNLRYLLNGWKLFHDKDLLAYTGNETLLNDHLHRWIDQADPEQKGTDIEAHRLTASGLLRSLEKDTDPINIRNFPILSEKLRLKPQISIIVSAETGAGKSSLALNLANALNHDYTVLYIDIEMTERIVNNRLLAIESGIPLDEIGRFGNIELRNEIEDTARKISQRKPFYIYHELTKLSEIEQIIHQVERDPNEPMIVFVDHLHLVSNGIQDPYQRATELAKSFKQIAKRENLILFLLAQQNRAGKSDQTKKPTLASLKDSGELENSADKVIFLWEKQDPGTLYPELYLVIGKNREAPLADIKISFDKPTQKITESDTEQFPESWR